jgi:hypothetical protein
MNTTMIARRQALRRKRALNAYAWEQRTRLQRKKRSVAGELTRQSPRVLLAFEFALSDDKELH